MNRTVAWGVVLLLAGLAGCAGTEKLPVPADWKSGQRTLEGGVVFDYRFDINLSKIDGQSCYMFVSGTLYNPSTRPVFRQSRLDFQAFSGDALLFRDISRPRADVMPGSRVQIELIESPVFRKHCPQPDRVEVHLETLR